MEVQDYYSPSQTFTQLLDPDTGQPTATAAEDHSVSLARIAAAIHAEAQKLTAIECEQVVKWMKHWKASRSPLIRQNVDRPGAFNQIVDQIKNGSEQKALQWEAARHLLISDAWVVLAFTITLAGVGSFFVSGVRWYWSVAFLVVGLIAYHRGSIRGVAAANTWKDQEQKYLWQCIRMAETISELHMAGLFAFLTNDKSVKGPQFADRVRTERERLTDALYRDPDYWLDEI
jgi:hypothetical protein